VLEECKQLLLKGCNDFQSPAGFRERERETEPLIVEPADFWWQWYGTV